jgi:hypothetical protein
MAGARRKKRGQGSAVRGQGDFPNFRVNKNGTVLFSAGFRVRWSDFRVQRLSLACIAAVFFVLTAAAGAQELKTMHSLQQAVQRGLVKFRVLSGRVSFEGARGNFQPPPVKSNEREEQLSIVISDDGDTAFSYQWSDKKKQLAIDVSSVSNVRIRYSNKDGDAQPPMEFNQPLKGETTLKIGPEGKQKIYSAPGLWHLMLAYPAETKQYLTPLLELLRPNWKLSESAAIIEKELLSKTLRDAKSDRKQWTALVEQLGNDSFAKRQAADRALRAADPVVMHFLEQLDFGRLDAEQQFRVSRIVKSLNDRLGDDSPDRIASWLAGDASVWLILLGRPEPDERRYAAAQLSEMLGEPIPVDPEAEPSTQKKQMEQLRLRIESLK